MFARAILSGASLTLAVALAGCGGGSPQPDPSADRQRWAHAVDTACARAAAHIVQRGRPATGDAVPELVDGAITDARDGAAAIVAVRRPQRPDAKVKAFLAEAEALDEPLASLAAAAERRDLDGVNTAIRAVRLEARLLRSQAHDAGLRDCARLEGADAGLDALEALSAGRSLAVAERRAGKRITTITAHPPGTTAEAVTYFDRLQTVLRRLSHDVDMPLGGRFEEPGLAYYGAVADANDLCVEIASRLEQHKVKTAAAGAALDRRLKRAGDRMERAYLRVQRTIRQVARPLIPEPPGATTPDEPAES